MTDYYRISKSNFLDKRIVEKWNPLINKYERVFNNQKIKEVLLFIDTILL